MRSLKQKKDKIRNKYNKKLMIQMLENSKSKTSYQRHRNLQKNCNKKFSKRMMMVMILKNLSLLQPKMKNKTKFIIKMILKRLLQIKEQVRNMKKLSHIKRTFKRCNQMKQTILQMNKFNHLLLQISTNIRYQLKTIKKQSMKKFKN